MKIIDHLDWKNEEEHLLLLQEKINMYLTFIESGQIYEDAPEREGKKIVISVSFACALTENAIKFLFTVANILDAAGYQFEYETEEPYKLRCILLD